MNSTDLCPPFPRREAPGARQAAAEVAPGQGTPGPQQEITTLFSAMASPGQGARAPVRLSVSPFSPGQPHSCRPDVLNYLSLLHRTGSPLKSFCKLQGGLKLAFTFWTPSSQLVGSKVGKSLGHLEPVRARESSHVTFVEAQDSKRYEIAQITFEHSQAFDCRTSVRS